MKIISNLIEDELKSSYLDYSMSVIVGRAIGAIEDGLKPVQRRILYAMYRAGLFPNKAFKKCARIVGDTLGYFHPHGDVPVYEALVRLAQPFALRYPLIEGQGNFGSIDGDPPAQMRYTEARLTPMAMELLEDIEKNTIDWTPNFDGSTNEPIYLPGKIPNLLINGCTGIAVGMATSIPPHNLSEVCDAAIALLENESISEKEILKIIKGPDFPTGGVIFKKGLEEAYLKGKGQIVVEGVVELEEKPRRRIIIKEIPYGVNKAQLVAEIAELVNAGKISGISDLRDESDREGIRIVLELKQGANPELVLNQILSHTNLRLKQSVIFLCLVGGVPKILSIKDLLNYFLAHRITVIKRKCQFELNAAKEKAHIIQGLLLALENIDAIILTIKTALSTQEALNKLIKKFELSEAQAKAVLEMRLSKLASLERQKLNEEFQELKNKIAQLQAILESETKIKEIIKNQLQEIKKYDDGRRTRIVEEEPGILEPEDLIKDEEIAVILSADGLIKRVALENWRTQKRGGKGLVVEPEEKIIKKAIVCRTHDWLLFFTNLGKLHWLKAWQVPEATRYAKGSFIKSLLQLEKNEDVVSVLSTKDFYEDKFLFLVTNKGTIKKTPLSEFANPRRGGIIAINLPENQNLVVALITSGKDEIVLASSNGYAIKFDEAALRALGRTAQGVIGMRLKEGDKIISAIKVEPNKALLTIAEKGFAKKTGFEAYRKTSRGAKGVKNLKVTEKNGKAIICLAVSEEDEVMVFSKNGKAIKFKVKEISFHSRVTQGIRVMQLDQGDAVVDGAIV